MLLMVVCVLFAEQPAEFESVLAELVRAAIVSKKIFEKTEDY